MNITSKLFFTCSICKEQFHDSHAMVIEDQKQVRIDTYNGSDDSGMHIIVEFLSGDGIFCSSRCHDLKAFL